MDESSKVYRACDLQHKRAALASMGFDSLLVALPDRVWIE